MTRRPGDLTPNASVRHFFGAELRHWRERRGLSQATLGRTVHVSPDLIAKVEKATRWPTRSLVASCEDVLNTGGVLVRLLQLLEHQRLSGEQAGATDIGSLVRYGAPYVVVLPTGTADHPAEIVVSTKIADARLATADLPPADGDAAEVYPLRVRSRRAPSARRRTARPA
jgi:transcriptional regulator with XRE-family HTH domain